MRGHEGCLDVYTEEGWQTYYAELKKLSNKKKEERAYLRMVTSRMSCSEFDKLGRINIPQVLRTHAHVQSLVLVNILKYGILLNGMHSMMNMMTSLMTYQKEYQKMRNDKYV